MGEIEKVLVIERRVLGNLELFQGVSFELELYLPKLWEGEGVSFIPRMEAERNPVYKQIIPYVIMMHGGTYLCYVRGRQVGEPRLTEKVSIGIGGHINPSDRVSVSRRNIKEVYLNALAREVEEEVIVETEHDDKIVGLINDDSNNVGRVHFGIIHLWRLLRPNVRNREQEICQLRFMNIDELHHVRSNMETWSQLCLDSLRDIALR
jgi:predicted NUDIX family phosphoesterase